MQDLQAGNVGNTGLVTNQTGDFKGTKTLQPQRLISRCTLHILNVKYSHDTARYSAKRLLLLARALSSTPSHAFSCSFPCKNP
jgi:hypothetical protein